MKYTKVHTACLAFLDMRKDMMQMKCKFLVSEKHEADILSILHGKQPQQVESPELSNFNISHSLG